MTQYELLLPKMGESVAEATIIKWEKKIGDQIAVDDIVLEIATDKVDSEVPSPIAGKLVEQRFKENEVAQVGDVIAIIELYSKEENKDSADLKGEPNVEITPEVPFIPEEIAEEKAKKDSIDFIKTDKFYSPLVKSIAQQEGVSLTDLDHLEGSGNEGRVTKDDLLKYISERGAENASVNTTDNPVEQQIVNVATPAEKLPAKQPETSTTEKSRSNTDEIVEMDRMRRLISDHMTSSKNTAVHVTSFVEADVTNMVLWRNRVKDSFEKREGEKITFTPIFVEAVTKAIKDMPMINISLNGNQIIKKKDINIGMAAALPSGNLIVPVIKNADQLSLVGLTKAVNDLAKRSRANKLQPDEVKDGTFTLTNIGGFGNIMGTPIINQPQVAILAVGTIKKKPAVLETEYGDVIAIRHMMYLSLSYDHRVVDGALGGSFVKRVADYLEQWDVDREI